MSGFLEFDCNYGCGVKIIADVSDWSECSDGSGFNHADRVHEWLGKRVMTALVDHHLRHCTEYYKHPDGRPWLRLVTS